MTCSSSDFSGKSVVGDGDWGLGGGGGRGAGSKWLEHFCHPQNV